MAQTDTVTRILDTAEVLFAERGKLFGPPVSED